jgi:hypothetical protein
MPTAVRAGNFGGGLVTAVNGTVMFTLATWTPPAGMGYATALRGLYSADSETYGHETTTGLAKIYRRAMAKQQSIFDLPNPARQTDRVPVSEPACAAPS